MIVDIAAYEEGQVIGDTDMSELCCHEVGYGVRLAKDLC